MSTFSVTDVLQHLEGAQRRPNSAKSRPFKGAALSGLWKVHFVDARFLLKNIYNEWGISSEKGNKFMELCKRVAAEDDKAPSPHGWQGRLGHEFVRGYENRAQKNKLTGEWLIFGVHEQRNFYLALCRHSDSPGQDHSIYRGIKELCSAEFPQLF